MNTLLARNGLILFLIFFGCLLIGYGLRPAVPWSISLGAVLLILAVVYAQLTRRIQ